MVCLLCWLVKRIESCRCKPRKQPKELHPTNSHLMHHRPRPQATPRRPRPPLPPLPRRSPRPHRPRRRRPIHRHPPRLPPLPEHHTALQPLLPRRLGRIALFEHAPGDGEGPVPFILLRLTIAVAPCVLGARRGREQGRGRRDDAALAPRGLLLRGGGGGHGAVVLVGAGEEGGCGDENVCGERGGGVSGMDVWGGAVVVPWKMAGPPRSSTPTHHHTS